MNIRATKTLNSLKNWEVSKTQNTIKLSAKTDDASLELPTLLDQVQALLPETGNSFNITIQQQSPLEVVISTNAVTSGNSQKKFHRLYTSGCYDLFHYGHLNIFKKSKELCDYLIVGVSTDELIEKEKGKRPVIPYEERARIVESIRYVDEVVPQCNKDKQAIVTKYNIDAISVGDDWKGKYPPVSCKMVYFPYTKSVSSTILKDTLSLLAR